MVLEAREKAEKVGYPIVGEEIKDASNVVDYDIHEEITIDNSSVFNANNDTTTGMANVIPGVNAPKLIANTSIIGGGGEYEPTAMTAKAYNNTHYYISDFNTIERDITQFTLSEETGNVQLEQLADGLKIPATGTYMLEVTYGWIPSQINCTDTMVVNGVTVHTFVGSYSQYGPNDPTETVYLSMMKGDIFKMHTAISRNVSSYYNETHVITIKFIKF